MEISLCKTLAAKHRLTLSQIFQKYGTEVPTIYGPLKAIRAIKPRVDKRPLVATFGGLPLRRQEYPVLNCDPAIIPGWNRRSELVQRLAADRCELCGSEDHVQVHHIRKLSDLLLTGRREKMPWENVMIARKRKTLVVCRSCHEKIDHGSYDGPSFH